MLLTLALVLLASAAADYAGQYPDLWSISEEGAPIPGLADDMIPQGIAYWKAKGWLIISNYRENGRPSTLTVVDAQTGALVKRLDLYQENGAAYRGHAGGVAVSARSLWVSSEGQAYRVPLEHVAGAPDRGDLRFTGRFDTGTRASFTTFADGVLWIGEFHLLPNYRTDPSHELTNRQQAKHHAWVAGFVLDEETGRPASPGTPDYVLSVTDKIQGMAVTPDRIILSQSFGRTRDSALMKYERPDLEGQPHTTVTVGGRRVPVWFLDVASLNRAGGVLAAPPMSEGIVTDGSNRLFVLFESASVKYRATARAPMDRLRVIRLDAWK